MKEVSSLALTNMLFVTLYLSSISWTTSIMLIVSYNFKIVDDVVPSVSMHFEISSLFSLLFLNTVYNNKFGAPYIHTYTLYIHSILS